MNQNPEQLARDAIDKILEVSGRIVQSKVKYNLAAGLSVVAQEYSTSLLRLSVRKKAYDLQFMLISI